MTVMTSSITKKKILFIHSAGPQGAEEGSTNLLAYLRKSLTEYEIVAPKMPDPENPQYELWKLKLEKEISALRDDAVLVGHSLGGSVLLKYLAEEGFEKRISALFLIASPYWGKKDWQIQEFKLPDNFPSTLPAIGQIFIYHSHDDEWVPFDHLRYYKKKLPQALERALVGRGHLFDKDNLPELIDDIRHVYEAAV
jgi:uncharacterized protein